MNDNNYNMIQIGEYTLFYAFYAKHNGKNQINTDKSCK